MMKAFSFLTILESLSKKLSILRTKMHSDDLRVDYESIASQLRVNPLFSRTSFGASFADLSRRASRNAAILTILFTIGVGSVSAQETVTWTPTENDLNTLKKDKSNSIHYITVGTGEKSFRIYAVRNEASSSTDVKLTFDNDKYKMDDNSMEKAGLAVFVPATSADVLDIRFYMYTTKSRKTYYASGATCPSSATTTSELATSATAYSFFNTYSKSTYYCAGGKNGGSGESYFTKIEVVFASSGGGETPDPGTGGDPDPGDECTKIFWFAKAADATTAGVENNTTTFSGATSGSNSASGSITIDGKSYSVTGRGSTNNTSITFTVPANKVGTLYGLATTSSSSGAARTLTLTNTASYSKTQSTSTSQSVAGEFTFTDMPAGSYTLAWDGNGAECMLCLKLCDAATPSCTAPTNVAISGAWDKFGGETISLTATPTGGMGDYSYQWQKYYGSTWNNITDNATATTANLVYESCDGSHSGTYRCVVSTGTDCSTASNGLQVKVYTLECYTNGTNIYHFTRNGNTQSGTLTLNLNANTAYKFKVHVDNDYYGNGGTINKDETNWVLGAELGTPDLTVNSGLGGTFTFTIDYSASGNSNIEGVPEISVTYPRKTIYLNPGVWNADGAKYAIYYFIDGHNAWSDFFVGDACGTYTTIPQWNGVTMIAVRLNSDATIGTWDKKWNQTGNIPVNNNDYVQITGWGNNGGDSPHTYTTYTVSTYSITFNGNGNTGGSMTNVTGITCGEDRTLAENGFTRTGYTFAGWATAADGTGTSYADKATISNITSDITLYAKWNAITYNITFDTENGTGGTTQVTATYNSSTIASITNPTRECYTFEGWYSGENGTGSLVINTTGVLQANVSGYTGTNGVWIATENKTLYAKWTKNATTLLLQRTGSEATPAGGVAVGGDAGTLNCIAEQGTIASYQWKQNTIGSKDGAVNAVGEGATTANFSPKPTEAGSYWYYCVATDECGNEVETSLSGCFQFNTLVLHTITFDPNGGNVEPTSATQALSGAAITLPTPTRDGHTFAGWYTAASGGTKIGDANASYIPTASITIYAQWETPCVAPTNAVINGGGTYNSGSNITLTVTANNITNGTTTYTWYRSNSGQEAAITAGPIQEASTNNTYVINSCVQSDAQVYYCLISNGDGCNAVASTSIAINVVTTYTLTYDANAGTDEVANMPAPEQHTPGTYTLSDLVPTRTGYTFAGWNRNPAGTGDNFNAADQFTTGALNETLYAKWTPETYYINYYEAVGEVNDISGLNQISIAGAPTSYTILDAVVLPALPNKDGYTATGWYSQWCVFENKENTQYWAGCEPTTDHSAGYYGHANYIVKYTPNVPAGTLTALECGTLYKVENMVPSGVTLSGTGQYATGISANGKFEVIGDAEETSGAAGTPEMKNEAAEFASQSFTARMYLKGASNTTGSGTTFVPTSRAVKFIVGESGTLDIYAHRVDRLYLKKVGDSGTTQLGTSTSGSGSMVSHNVTAGTYYIYATGNSTCVYGIQLNCCSTPAAPTAFTAGSITSTGATFTITDAGDAASYDIYYSTSSTAPTAGTAATTTSDSKTKEVTGLTASTTYYTWVRSVCDASHKSAWVAGSSFTTNAPTTHTVTYETNGGTGTTPTQTALAQGATFTVASATGITKDGYTFAGWSDGINTYQPGATYTMPASNVTLTAQWTANPSGGGGGETCITFGSSKDVSESTATTEVGDFTIITYGVNDKATKLGENSDYIIITSSNGYIKSLTMNGNQNGIKVTSSSDNNTYGNEQTILFANTKTITFAADNITSVKIMRNGGNVQFSEICITTTPLVTYNVTYKANGGTGDDVTSKVAVVGACPNSFTAPTGTTFKGWNTAAEGTGTDYAVGAEVQSDLTLYAQWGVAYTVTYNANGATSGTAPKDNNKYFSGDQVSVLGNISNMTKTNHSFQGWATTANGEVAYTAGSKMTMPADNVTLYAVWNNEKCGTEYVTWTLPTNNKAFTSFSTDEDGLTATASPTNSDVTLGSDAKADLTTKLIPTAETSYLEFKFAVPDNKQFTPCELTLPVQPITSACNFTITVTDGTNTLTRTFTNCAHGSITTLTMNNTSTITFTGDVSIKIYSTGTTHGYRLGSTLSIFGAVVDVQNPCTTPVLPTLAATTVCEGENVLWNAAITNKLLDGETVEYKWVKSPNTSTILATTAQYQIANATEAATGTYIVSATVSAEGKNRTIAHTQVRLTVTPTTATPTITADKDKVYAGNSVTLTAATASTGVTYQWYTCNADGSNEQEIGDATAATYTIASAGDAGTYYYKVRVSGDGTHSCGDAEKVYTLVVSSSNSGQTTCAEIAGQFASGVYNLDTDFVLYGVDSKGNLDEGVASSQGTSRCGGENGWFFNRQRFAVTFPVDVVSFSFMGYQSNDRTIENVKTTAELLSADTEYQTIEYTSTVTKENNCQTFVVTPENTITAGTIVWIDLSNALNISEICYVPYSNVVCTDPDVTATVDNATICEDNESTVTFTATGAADGATFQWQKHNGTSWEEISGATNATYTINPIAAENTGKYRVVATKVCNRISNELTLTVLTAPVFNTFNTAQSVMTRSPLSISDVQATNATGYTWYKSADETFNSAEDTQIGNTQDLMISSVAETAGSTFYLFCVASNSCGSVTSNAITVTVTPFVEEECATKGNEGDHEFGFVNTSCSSDTYGDSKTPVWKTNSRSKYLTYTAPEGRYFATAKVTVAHTGGTECGYAYSTNRGTTWEVAELDGLSTTLTAITIDDLPANVNAFRISRNLTAQDGEKGSDSGNFYLAEACFTYKNACTATTLTPDNASPEYTMGGNADFTEPTFTLKAGETTLEGQTLTYSSSNTAIATVESNGNVHFEGMTGTVTITATFAGGEINEIEYCACQGSYTITVDCDEEAPKIVAATGTKLDGCNNSITLEAKMQDGTTDFDSGSYQWYRNGVAIDGATDKAYTATQSGTYTVVHYGKCDQWSTNKAVITNDNSEPSVERLTPFQYYHADKNYSAQMKDRHLFAVTSYGTYEGKRYHLTATRNGETVDVSTSTAFSVITSQDNVVDTVMIDLNQLKGKYSEGDEIVITCTAVNSCNELSVINNSITIHVIDKTPVLALICSGAKADGTGTRVTAELTVGGDFLTGYNPADLCQQTSNTTFDPNTEWGFYTELKKNYIVVPVNGYAQFNKLNYEPFDVLLLTDYPKSSHSEAAQKIIDDMAELCDYRPLLSFKTHFQSANWAVNGEYKYNKWTKKGFVTAPVVPATTGTYVNIVCYAHPMFEEIQAVQGSGSIAFHDYDDHNQLVYEMLTGPGHESGKGIQGFELADANSFVTIGLVHYNATSTKVEVEEDGEDHTGGAGESHHTHVQWTSGENDRLLVAIAERQANIEARMILFSINCGAQSLQTEGGRQVILECLQYLYDPDNDNPSLIEVADCHLTFDNGAGNIDFDEVHYEEHGGTGTRGDGLWTTAANWAPKYDFYPSANNEVRIAAPCTIDIPNAAAFSVQIVEEGKITINTGKALTVRSTITRYDKDNATISPTESEDIFIGSTATGNGTLIFNNDAGDTKATVEMYSTADADTENYSAAASTWQYIGTPHSDVQNAVTNYYNSWLYQYNSTGESWDVIPNGGPLEPFRGYCITHPETPHTYTMTGTLTATTSHSAEIPAGKYVVIANSWTAPIQVANFEDDDLENLTDKTVYLFNTGSDPEGDGTITPDASATQETRYAAGTYISIPIHSAPYTGDATISSMQGFYVVGGTSDGAVHLDYDKLVRPKEGQSIVGPPMHAPKRIAAQEQSPIVLKMIARGSRYDDNLFVLEREDFTRGYDSGWDGEEWGGSDVAPILYTTNENNVDETVSAIPDMEGTIITFRAGEDSEYTFQFDFDDMAEALYLLDIDTQIYTRVLKGNTYTFTCADKKPHNRFILTRKAPQIATGVDNSNAGEGAKAVKFIKEDKMFIFMNGTLYDATGKMVVKH